jgi:hypothetical protein
MALMRVERSGADAARRGVPDGVAEISTRRAKVRTWPGRAVPVLLLGLMLAVGVLLFTAASFDLAAQLLDPRLGQASAGQWLSQRLTAQMLADDPVTTASRAATLYQQAARLRELAGLLALCGLLLALFGPRGANAAAARTTSKGVL